MLTVHQEQDQRGFQELFSHLTVSLTVQSSIGKARGFWFESQIKGAFWNKHLFHLLEKGWIAWQNTFYKAGSAWVVLLHRKLIQTVLYEDDLIQTVLYEDDLIKTVLYEDDLAGTPWPVIYPSHVSFWSVKSAGWFDT